MHSFSGVVLVLFVSMIAEGQGPVYSQRTTLFVDSETVLSGTDIFQDTPKEVIARWGEPTEILPAGLIEPIYTYAHSKKNHTYEWSGRTSRVRISAVDGSTISSIEVCGSGAEFEEGTTGKGLKLGANTDSVRRIYFNASHVPIWSADDCGIATIL